ncbi:glycosyltransferase [Clostridium sediminicola]|uniref:MGDG synthase family glycosyltransferase n=1 Tax=Clostridium sediminicola TaxID=3114879 RepID=UPI0031F21428
MGRKVLFISSDLTGHGHKSITEAICKKLGILSPDIDIKVIDGFYLAGKLGEKTGKMYVPMTIYAKSLWGFLYKISSNKHKKVNSFTAKIIKKRFLEVINSFKPDLIVSVHAVFVGSIIKILQDSNLEIPVVTQVADLVSISALWSDPNAMYTICPTLEAKERVMRFGVPEEKIILFNLPVRENFCEFDKINVSHINDKLTFLIMNGCEGNGNVKKTAETLLSNFNCKVIIITGRNEKLKKLLDLTLKQTYKEDIEILGYINNVEKYMSTSDILIARGSPNVLMEGINCCIPIIVSGAFPGQEKENPDFVVNNNLGVYCDNYKQLPKIIKDLTQDDYLKLKEIRKNQLNYRDLKVSEKISKFIINNVENVS